MEQWAFTTDTGMAAAFGTLGMPVRVFKKMLENTGQVKVTFGIGLMNVEGNYRTKPLQAAWKKGKLDPTHPLRVIMGTFRVRDMVLDCMNKGVMIRHVEEVPGLWSYEVGDTGLPGAKAGDAVIRTGDLKLVCALGRVGLRLLAIDGPKHQRLFTVEAARRGVNGVELMGAWRKDMESIPWEKPFAQAMRGLHNRERILDAVNRSDIKVTILGRGSMRAVVTADAEGNTSDKAMRTACEFLDG